MPSASITPYISIQCPCATAAQSDSPSSSSTSNFLGTTLLPPSSFDHGNNNYNNNNNSSSSISSSNDNNSHNGGSLAAPETAGGARNSTKVHPTATGTATAPSLSLSDVLDPRASRSSYGLYPLEHLLYCSVCNQIRCPRCTLEEIVTVFCPSCMSEVPNINLRAEGNRCTRNCFQCPVCVGPLAVTSIDPSPDSHLLGSVNASVPGPSSYALSCTYCHWTSTEIGIRFDKHIGIYSQLARVRNGGAPRQVPRNLRDPRRKDSLLSNTAQPPPTLETVSASASASASSSSVLPPLVEAPDSPDEQTQPPQEQQTAQPESSPTGPDFDIDLHFSALQTFYRNQLAAFADKTPGAFSSLANDLSLASSDSFSRLMALYSTGRSLASMAKKGQKQTLTMREARTPDEGLKLATLDESAAIGKLLRGTWDDTVSAEQNAEQIGTGCLGASQSLRFQDSLRPVPCLLRARRSRRCQPCRHIVTKPESRLNQTRYRMQLVASSYIPTITVRPMPSPSPPPGGPTAPPTASSILRPLRPTQFILKFRNPIFEKVRVKLATPRKTPGRFSAEVTLLCHEFHIDANTDMWEDAQDALKQQQQQQQQHQQGDRHVSGDMDKYEVPYERARNWVSIVIEVKADPIGPLPADMKEDEDVLEIPIYVRLEWDEKQGDGGGGGSGSLDKDKDGKDKDGKETRGLEYWCVVGVGRIVQD